MIDPSRVVEPDFAITTLSGSLSSDIFKVDVAEVEKEAKRLRELSEAFAYPVFSNPALLFLDTGKVRENKHEQFSKNLQDYVLGPSSYLNNLALQIQEKILGLEPQVEEDQKIANAIKQISFYVMVYKKALENGDMQTANAISVAIKLSGVYRLIKPEGLSLYHLLSKEIQTELNKILAEEIFSDENSYKKQRDYINKFLETNPGALIPTLNFYRTDITFYLDGNNKRLTEILGSKDKEVLAALVEIYTAFELEDKEPNLLLINFIKFLPEEKLTQLNLRTIVDNLNEPEKLKKAIKDYFNNPANKSYFYDFWKTIPIIGTKGFDTLAKNIELMRKRKEGVIKAPQKLENLTASQYDENAAYKQSLSLLPRDAEQRKKAREKFISDNPMCLLHNPALIASHLDKFTEATKKKKLFWNLIKAIGEQAEKNSDQEEQLREILPLADELMDSENVTNEELIEFVEKVKKLNLTGTAKAAADAFIKERNNLLELKESNPWVILSPYMQGSYTIVDFKNKNKGSQTKGERTGDYTFQEVRIEEGKSITKTCKTTIKQAHDPGRTIAEFVGGEMQQLFGLSAMKSARTFLARDKDSREIYVGSIWEEGAKEHGFGRDRALLMKTTAGTEIRKKYGNTFATRLITSLWLGNYDPHGDNLIVDKNDNLVLIDHDASFLMLDDAIISPFDKKFRAKIDFDKEKGKFKLGPGNNFYSYTGEHKELFFSPECVAQIIQIMATKEEAIKEKVLAIFQDIEQLAEDEAKKYLLAFAEHAGLKIELQDQKTEQNFELQDEEEFLIRPSLPNSDEERRSQEATTTLDSIKQQIAEQLTTKLLKRRQSMADFFLNYAIGSCLKGITEELKNNQAPKDKLKELRAAIKGNQTYAIKKIALELIEDQYTEEKNPRMHARLERLINTMPLREYCKVEHGEKAHPAQLAGFTEFNSNNRKSFGNSGAILPMYGKSFSSFYYPGDKNYKKPKRRQLDEPQPATHSTYRHSEYGHHFKLDKKEDRVRGYISKLDETKLTDAKKTVASGIALVLLSDEKNNRFQIKIKAGKIAEELKTETGVESFLRANLEPKQFEEIRVKLEVAKFQIIETKVENRKSSRLSF